MNHLPQDLRRSSDYEKVKKLVENSENLLEIESIEGEPPRQFVIAYHCKGIEKIDKSGTAIIRDRHRVEITLPANYPVDRPYALFLTPIFHPNVFENNVICLGETWNVNESLDNLILRIGKIIQYDVDYMNLQSPANWDAMSWAESHRDLFPIGTDTFLQSKPESGKEEDQVVWTDLS
jgi:hypothetical protein